MIGIKTILMFLFLLK